MGEGNGHEVGVDYLALGQVRGDLNDEKENVVAARDAMLDPAAQMFGDSDNGRYLFSLVQEGHQAIRDALTEAETALTKMDTGIGVAVKELEGADAEAEANAIVIQNFVEATRLMSLPLVLFNKKTIQKMGPFPI